MALPRSGRFQAIGALVSGLIVVAFCLLLLRHDPLLFWNDDYEISILPVFADVARSWSERNLPLLSPYSWICGNLAGEFQYGTFSIFVNAAVVLIRRFSLTFPQQAAALSMAHLFVLAAGGYLLARGRNLNAALAMMVAFIAALNGWIICWGATNWFGALGAFAWLPWAWWGLERALDPARGRWRFVWPAPFVYLLMTGGFPYTVLMLALLTAWLAIKSLVQTGRLSSIVPLFFGSLLGLGLSAPAWLALLDYAQGSVRTAQPVSAHFQWAVPLAALPGFILPNWTVNWVSFSGRSGLHTATELACGLTAPAALLSGLIANGRLLVRRIRWELGLLVFVLALSILPSPYIFQWSFRWLPFLALVLALCAAEALQLLRDTKEVRGRAVFFTQLTRNPGAIALALVSVTAVAMISARTAGQSPFTLIWITLAIAAIWAALEFLPPSFRALQSWAPAVVTFTILLATFLCLPTNCGVPKFNLAQELLSPAPLDPSRLYFSIYPPPDTAYSLEAKPGPIGELVRPGSTSMWSRLRFINGYSPIRAAGVAREFQSFVHGHIDPATAEYLLESHAGRDGKLAVLGIDGIIVASEFAFSPKPDAEWILLASTSEARVYHRQSAPFTTVRSLTFLDSIPGEQFVSAAISQIEDSRNRVGAQISVPVGDQPALIAFSRPYFRGYQARIDSTRLNVTSYRDLMPVVQIPPGTSGCFVLVYRPWWLLCGGAIAVISALLLSFAGLAAIFPRKNQ